MLRKVCLTCRQTHLTKNVSMHMTNVQCFLLRISRKNYLSALIKAHVILSSLKMEAAKMRGYYFVPH